MKIEANCLDSFLLNKFYEYSLNGNSQKEEEQNKKEIKISVPLFQRKFCWQKKQFITLWNNILQCNLMNGHHIGKLYLYNNNNLDNNNIVNNLQQKNLICVDGQQRLTTLLILLCSLRNVCLKSLQNINDNNTLQNTENNKTLQKVIIGFIKKIHELIFINLTKDELNNFNFLNEYNLQNNNYNEFIHKVLNKSRFVPTFDDRLTFFTILMNENLDTLQQNYNLQHCHNNLQSDNSHYNNNCNNQIILNPWMILANKLFTERIEKYLNKNNTLNNIKTLQNNIKSLQLILTNIISGIRFVSIEFTNEEKNAQQTYQQIYRINKVNQIQFKITTPGIDLSYSDLIRNYLLSYFENENLQKEMYDKYWLPLERYFATKINNLKDNNNLTFLKGEINCNNNESDNCYFMNSDSSDFVNKYLNDNNVTNTNNKNNNLLTIYSEEELESRKLDQYIEWFIYFNGLSEKEQEEKVKQLQNEKNNFTKQTKLEQMIAYGMGKEISLFNDFLNYFNNEKVNWKNNTCCNNNKKDEELLLIDNNNERTVKKKKVVESENGNNGENNEFKGLAKKVLVDLLNNLKNYPFNFE
ncbi:hypothetical protein ABK040_013988 [Willaertia magna]